MAHEMNIDDNILHRIVEEVPGWTSYKLDTPMWKYESARYHHTDGSIYEAFDFENGALSITYIDYEEPHNEFTRYSGFCPDVKTFKFLWSLLHPDVSPVE